MPHAEQLEMSPLQVLSALTRTEIAILVASDLSPIDFSEAESLGASLESLQSLVAANLLVHMTHPKLAERWAPTALGKACAEAVCPKCFTLMSPGKALIGPPPGITYEGEWLAKFRDCLKCHSCGHSEQTPHNN